MSGLISPSQCFFSSIATSNGDFPCKFLIDRLLYGVNAFVIYTEYNETAMCKGVFPYPISCIFISLADVSDFRTIDNKFNASSILGNGW